MIWTTQPRINWKQQCKPTRVHSTDFCGDPPELDSSLYSLIFCRKIHLIYKCILLQPHIQSSTTAYFYNKGNIRPFAKVNMIVLFYLLF